MIVITIFGIQTNFSFPNPNFVHLQKANSKKKLKCHWAASIQLSIFWQSLILFFISMTGTEPFPSLTNFHSCSNSEFSKQKKSNRKIQIDILTWHFVKFTHTFKTPQKILFCILWQRITPLHDEQQQRNFTTVYVPTTSFWLDWHWKHIQLFKTAHQDINSCCYSVPAGFTWLFWTTNNSCILSPRYYTIQGFTEK